MHRKTSKAVCFALAIFSLGLDSNARAQQPVSPDVKPAGPRVELSLIVTDKDKKSVNAIRKEEVRVIEGKVEQALLSVEADDRPIDYGLVIDSSNSLRQLIATTIEAAKLIIINRRSSDEIFIERFISSDQVEKVHDFSSDNTALLESLKSIKLGGGQSAVIDALYIGAEYVAQHNKSNPNRRKALVVITDGEDRNSFHKLDNLIKLLREEAVQVFVLGLVIDLDSETSLIRQVPAIKHRSS